MSEWTPDWINRKHLILTYITRLTVERHHQFDVCLIYITDELMERVTTDVHPFLSSDRQTDRHKDNWWDVQTRPLTFMRLWPYPMIALRINIIWCYQYRFILQSLFLYLLFVGDYSYIKYLLWNYYNFLITVIFSLVSKVFNKVNKFARNTNKS